MIQRGLRLVALGLGLVLSLPACDSSGGGGGSLSLTACSLGCTSATPSAQFTCGITDVAVNQEIRLTFNRPINLDTVDNNTFQVVEVGTGTTPPSTFILDPNDARILIYRPLLTFDSSGNPSFGLKSGATYSVRVPGTNLDGTGPFIEGLNGEPNGTRLQCTVVASQGVFDPKPGPPRATVTVIKDGVEVPAQNGFDIDSDSTIRFQFNDLMNPGTLVDPVEGTSATISISVDPDGNVADAGDQIPIQGTYSIIVNQFALTTSVVFTPDGLYPSRGADPLNPRRIVVRLPNSIVDLGGNSLINTGEFIFVPKQQVFAPIEVVETFQNNNLEDVARTSNEWSVPGFQGVDKGPGGGFGVLGDLFLDFGQNLTLNTDSEDFSGVNDPRIFHPESVVDGEVDPMTGGLMTPITDGVFEFSSLTIQPGATLTLEGSQAARILVRGQTSLQGNIIAAADPTPNHDSTSVAGGVAGEPGPGGAAGGAGGTLPDGTGFEDIGGVANPGVMLYDDVNGQPGGGISVDMGMSFAGGGGGGAAWPQPTADFPNMGFPADIGDLGELSDPKIQFDRRAGSGNECEVPTAGSPGGGGGYSIPGRGAETVLAETGEDPDPPRFFFAPDYRFAPDTEGGDNSGLAIDDTVMSLDPDAGFLRGGSGGGGGGSHLQGSMSNGRSPFDCHDVDAGPSGDSELTLLVQSSGAAGGSGGGAVQLFSGRDMVFNGVVDVSGGRGGSRLNSTSLATPGGGGSGGAFLVQAPEILFSPLPRRIDYNGGAGGTGVNGMRAGLGSPGLVRVETFLPLPDFNQLSTRLDPTPADLETVYGEADFTRVFSIAELVINEDGAGGRSGAQSCWIQPEGNFFLLNFAEDDPGGELGWDLSLLVPGRANPQSFRGPNEIAGIPVIQDFIGEDLGVGGMVVRFQGARLTAPLGDPCDVTLFGAGTQILPGSLTPWVRHPSELNNMDASLSPNMFRFQILWDPEGRGYGMINGVLELTVRATPD